MNYIVLTNFNKLLQNQFIMYTRILSSEVDPFKPKLNCTQSGDMGILELGKIGRYEPFLNAFL